MAVSRRKSTIMWASCSCRMRGGGIGGTGSSNFWCRLRLNKNSRVVRGHPLTDLKWRKPWRAGKPSSQMTRSSATTWTSRSPNARIESTATSKRWILRCFRKRSRRRMPRRMITTISSLASPIRQRRRQRNGTAACSQVWVLHGAISLRSSTGMMIRLMWWVRGRSYATTKTSPISRRASTTQNRALTYILATAQDNWISECRKQIHRLLGRKLLLAIQKTSFMRMKKINTRNWQIFQRKCRYLARTVKKYQKGIKTSPIVWISSS